MPAVDVGGAENGVVGMMAVAAVSQLLVSLALFAWGRWVARRRGGTGWRRAAWMPIAALVLSVVGMVVSTVTLVAAFDAIATADPADKARQLAQHISEAMNATALFAVPSTLLYAASFVSFAIGSLLRPRASALTPDPSP